MGRVEGMSHRFEIDLACCRARQQRLLKVMEEMHLDLVVLSRAENIQWLVGPRYSGLFEPVAALDGEGRCTLVAPNEEPERAAADRVATYEAQWLATLRNDQRQASADVLAAELDRRRAPRTIGVEYSHFGPHLAGIEPAELIDIEPALYQLRRFKHPDELAHIRHAIEATRAMYVRAREIIEPGVRELYVYQQLYAAAVETLGEPPTACGNDYACGLPGGPARDRKIEAGELYILDLGPAFRGYYADNCRTVSVDRRPTDEQQAAWESIAAIFPLVESKVKPGLSCAGLFDEVQARLDAHLPKGFTHHLGHGIGLYPHEAPHLNPEWDDTFDEGDVFTVEPGLYSRKLRGGIRLEQNYRVTADGVERLTDFPLGLVV